jgi:hypothetical protein
MEVSKVDFDKDKVKFKIAISKIKEENDVAMKNRTRNLFKAIITAIAGIILGSGVVFAGTKVYEKIWKEPESYTYEEMVNALPSAEISEEEKKDLISEDEAKEKGLEILEKLGYENQTINRIELKRGYSEDTTSYYMIKTKWGYEEGLTVEIDANSGEFLAFNDMDLKYKHLQSEILTDEEIAKIATNVYNQLGFKGEYKLSDTKAEDYYFENQASKVLGAKFYKYYDGIKNKYEQFSVSFIAVDGEVKLNSVLLSKDTTYQKNPLVISEEEAINTVKSKEQEFSPLEITNITSELSIEKMNTFIYLLENDKYDITANNTEDEIYYKTDDIARKVWKIKIEHNVSIREYANDYNKYVKEGMDKVYYVDATTGEIIGGENRLFDYEN